MPRFAAEKARSPERIPYHARKPAATPIEIPRRSRFMPSPVGSPAEQSSSPELVFDMSPTSTSFPVSSTIHSMTIGHSKELDDQPFMYSVPKFAPTATWPRRKASRQHVAPTRSLTPIPFGGFGRSQQLEITTLEATEGDRTIAFETDSHSGLKTPSITKVTGFFPLNADKPVVPDERPKSMERLSPPPRRSSYSPSPWILPGKRDHYTEEDLSYSLADPSAFEFQRHLLHRLEHKRSSRFASLRSCL